MKFYSITHILTHEIAYFKFLNSLCEQNNINYKTFMNYKQNKPYPIIKGKYVIRKCLTNDWWIPLIPYQY